MTPEQLGASADKVWEAFRRLDTVTFEEFPLFMQEASIAGIELVDRMTQRVFQNRAHRRAVELDAARDDIRCQLAVKFQRERLVHAENDDEIAIGELRARLEGCLATSDEDLIRWSEDHAVAAWDLAAALGRAGDYEESALRFEESAASFAVVAGVGLTAGAEQAAAARDRAAEMQLLQGLIANVRQRLGVGPVEAILPLPPLPEALPNVPQIEFKRDN